jgi:sensor histidine kinase regulating citrate/malate metabolism
MTENTDYIIKFNTYIFVFIYTYIYIYMYICENSAMKLTKHCLKKGEEERAVKE